MTSRRDEWRRPSGARLPLFLRKRWKEHQARNGDPTVSLQVGQEGDERVSQGSPQADATEINRIFSATSLEERYNRVSAAIIEVQKQLYRGEDMYHEETHAHGNLAKGWDAFVDARDIGTQSSSSQGGSGTGGGGRRMPSDHRWFSNSCRSVTRTSKPSTLLSKAIAPPIARTEANTPMVDTSEIAGIASTLQQHQPSMAQTTTVPAGVSIHKNAAHQTVLMQDNTSFGYRSEPSNTQSLGIAPMGTMEGQPIAPLASGGLVNTMDAWSAQQATLSSKTNQTTEHTPVRRNTRKRKAGDT